MASEATDPAPTSSVAPLEFKIENTKVEINGTKLPYHHVFSPTPKAHLLIFHGYSDHSGIFKPFEELLPDFELHIFDQRGWGTNTPRGQTGPSSTVMSDAASILKHVINKAGTLPLFVLGHSMGGATILTLAANPAYHDMTCRVTGWIAEAPLIRLPPTQAPWTLEVKLGRLAAKLMPHFTLVRRVSPEYVCRNPEWVKQVSEDPLIHYTCSLEGLAGMLDRSAALDSGAVLAKVPLLIVHGTEDKITSHDASQAYAKRVDAKFVSIKDGWHALHHDIVWPEFKRELLDFMKKRMEFRASL